MMKDNSTIDHTYRRGRALPNYNGKSITILDMPCFREKHEDYEDETTFSSQVASRIDEILKIVAARADELGKMHMLVRYTASGDPEWL